MTVNANELIKGIKEQINFNNYFIISIYNVNSEKFELQNRFDFSGHTLPEILFKIDKLDGDIICINQKIVSINSKPMIYKMCDKDNEEIDVIFQRIEEDLIENIDDGLFMKVQIDGKKYYYHKLSFEPREIIAELVELDMIYFIERTPFDPNIDGVLSQDGFEKRFGVKF